MKRLFLILIFAAVTTWSQEVLATTLLQLNLIEMSERADKIFRGKTMEITPSSTEIGGSEIPILIYKIEVEEAFQGNFKTAKGKKFAEIRMLGNKKSVVHGNIQSHRILPELPELEMGETYLLFTTVPSAIGLSTIVGLGQGCFLITGYNDKEIAVNAFNNRGIFRGIEPSEVTDIVTLLYSELKDRLTAILKKQ